MQATAGAASNAAAGSDSMCVYHEKQAAALCAQHTLNNLLQGPYFSAVDLSEIAQELDARERELMYAQGTETADAIRFAAQDSINVDESGNFSVAVLSTALSRSHGVHMLRCALQSDFTADAAVQGYVCNLESHWLALRRMGGCFWNLNSMLDRPARITDFYLSAFLGGLHSQGYTIFKVREGLPPPARSLYGDGQWHRIADLLQPVANAPRAAPTNHNDAQLMMAIQQSLVTAPDISDALVDAGGAAKTEDELIQQAIALSQADQGDDDLQLALAMSMSRNR